VPFCIWDGYEFSLRVAEGGEGAAQDCAGVDVDSVVAPLGCFDWSVAVDYGCCAVIVGGPVETDGQALIVGLAIGFAVEAE